MNKSLFYIIILSFTISMLESKISYLNDQPVIDLDELLQRRTDIEYHKLSDSCMMSCPANDNFLENKMWWEDDPIEFPERFVVSISDGYVYSRKGTVIVDNMYIDEFIWAPTKAGRIFPLVDVVHLKKPKKVCGTVVVLAQGGCGNYYHWMLELLPRFELLQEANIDYDYIYTQISRPFMKESLTLLGINSDCIIPARKDIYIQADTLIVPSIASPFGYPSEYTINFLRKTFIPLAQKSIEFRKFSKKVFISRKRSNRRKIINEDDVFGLFEPYGFVAYNLEDLSVLEQVALFHNAEIIVGEHGAGLTNLVFAQPETKVVEIFQARYDAMYWYLSQALKLKYIGVKTIEFADDNGFESQPVVPLEPIKKCINRLYN